MKSSALVEWTGIFLNPIFSIYTNILTHLSHALKFGSQKLNLHLSGKEFEPKASKVQPGSEDLCFITDHPIDNVLDAWKSAGLEVR